MEHKEGFNARKNAERIARNFAQRFQINQLIPQNLNVQNIGEGNNQQQGTANVDQGLNQAGQAYQGYQPINLNEQGNLQNQYQNRPAPLLNLVPVQQQAQVTEIQNNQRVETNSPEETKENFDTGTAQYQPLYGSTLLNPTGSMMQSSIFTPFTPSQNQNQNQNQNQDRATQIQRLQQRLQIDRIPASTDFSEEDFDFESQDERASGPAPDFDERNYRGGIDLGGGRNSKVSAQPLRTSKKLSEHSLTRDLMSSGPQSYVRRSDNSIQPLRQLRYVERATATDVGFGASLALAAWSRFGGETGAVTAEDFYAYITRPGVRPTDYLIIDTRAEGGRTRLSNIEQAMDRVHVIPYSSDKCMFTAQEFTSMRDGVPASQAECDTIAPEIARTIENSRARYIIVHCAQGRNRSPVVAMGLHAYLRRVGSTKKVLLLVGGSDSFWRFVESPEAQRQYYEREENERLARQRTPEQIALQREQILRENPNVIELPGSPEIQIPQPRLNRDPTTLSTMPGTNAMLESNISPTWEQLTIDGARRQAGFSNLPLEEVDRADTINRDAMEFLRFYQNDPTPCKDSTCKPSDGGPDKGGPPGPGGGGGMGGGGFSGGMGGGMGGSLLTKRGMDPLDIAGGRLRKRSIGLFMPEPTGKGIRIIPRQ
ncbi:hypothetical protein TWF718_009056 [Orbilia javanica]|uniref:Rhodanese domain-containing protein n=1 Tax=Orbilia javanica TaxID=47235 RepID=A0AAN8MVH2_9PEZI